MVRRVGSVAAVAAAAALVAVQLPAAATGGAPEWHLRDAHGSGNAHHSFAFGRSGDRPLVGDWDGDGADTVGVRRGARFHLRDRLAGGNADHSFAFGRDGDEVVVGDWDGDGTDTVGIRRGNRFHLRDEHGGGAADRVFTFGRDGDEVVVGDWDGDGTDTVGIRRGNEFHLLADAASGQVHPPFRFGRASDDAVVGDWDGDGVDTVGVRRGNRFFLRDANTSGPESQQYAFGRDADVALTGDFDRDGSDTVGVWRADTDPGFDSSVRALPDTVRRDMTGTSWRSGCPVHLDDLRLVRVSHHGFDGARHRGELVVHRRVADDVVTAFERLYEAGFAIERMRRVDAYGGDDDASMADNNSSAFNCRRVAGSTSWSEHAYGTAIDLNPVQNPYVRGSLVDPPAGQRYLDRSDVRTGMIVRPGPVVDAFESIGWGWGGDWSSLKDYQHLSESGR